ncbi:MAG: AzlC family ABC transporter permease [Coriobacteriia bacterium]|nr:AzlC family ABC transporter permease [Coriobacteriia bacterium]MBN2823232.1 AzlC family ABC transporter permease [Coriobacteriia bacterium]
MSTTLPQQALCLSAQDRLVRGVRLGFPIFLGYMPVGAAFGILARSWGFSPIQAVACSATALAGAGQFIGLSLMKAGADVASVLIATTVVNLRYVLFGATLSPHVRDAGVAGQAALAFSVTDETFGVNINDLRRGTGDGWSMAGVGVVAWTGWVAGTALGVFGSGLVGDPYRFGVEFAMPAMFTALLVAQAEDKRHVIIGIVAAALTVICMLILPGKWYIVAASIGAATVGSAVYR